MSKVFGMHVGHGGDVDSELQKKIFDLMDEYVEIYRKTVIEVNLPPAHFSILMKIKGCFCIGNNQLYVFYERISSGLSEVYFLKLREQASPSLKTLAAELVGKGIFSNPEGFILPRNVLEMAPDKRKDYLNQKAGEDARGTIEYIKAGDTSIIIKDIIRLQEEANKILGKEIFIDKFAIIDGLFKPARNLDEFSTRIQSLNLLIDKVKINELRDLIIDNENDKESLKKLKSIGLLKAYLTKKGIGPQAVKSTLEVLQEISTLSAGPPRHEGKDINKAVNKIIKKWGFSFEKVNYPALWKLALEKYKEFLQNFINLLS